MRLSIIAFCLFFIVIFMGYIKDAVQNMDKNLSRIATVLEAK
jgi:hypothetical protein